MSKRKLKEALQRLANTHDKDIPQLIICTVDSFDLETQTCNCTPVGGDSTTTIPSVAVKADPTDGILITPAIGSTVVVAFSLKDGAYVMMFSDIQSLDVIVPKAGGGNPTMLKIADGSILMNDGSYDGLVKVNDLLTKLNNLESDLNTLKSALSAWVVVPGDGGGALKTVLAAYYGAPLTPTVKADLENSLITHGK